MQLTISVRPRLAALAAVLLVSVGAASARPGNRNPFIDHPEWVASIWP